MADLSFWNFAKTDPARPALIDPSGKTLTRGELLAESNRLVHGLRALGLEKGDAVALLSSNCAEFITVYLACAQAGWYLTPINWHLAAPEVAYILQDSGAKAFIAHERVAEIAQRAADEASVPAERRFSIGKIGGFRPYAELLAGQPDTLPDDRAAGAVMNYTSGTTGRPKGVKRPLPGFDPETAFGLFALYLTLFGIQPEDDNVHMVGSPLYHTAVLIFASCSLHLGHAIVVMDKWTPEDCLDVIQKHRVTTSHMVPTQFHRMLALPENVRKRYDVSSTRRMVHAAAPCPPDIKRKMFDWWGDSIYEYYAATEGGGTIVAPDEWRRFPGTVGKAWPSAEVRIYDDEANELPAGQHGTVYMKLGQANFEYKGDAEKTRKNRIGEFFTVGDVGYLNEEGFLFLVDRKIDMIISGGANIYPAEIENVFLSHPKVGDAAVFGVPNEDWGEEVKAVIEPADGVAPSEQLKQELMAFCQERLGKFKQPRTIDFIDAMPRDPNGKLYKRKLRDPYWAGRERQV